MNKTFIPGRIGRKKPVKTKKYVVHHLLFGVDHKKDKTLCQPVPLGSLGIFTGVLGATMQHDYQGALSATSAGANKYIFKLAGLLPKAVTSVNSVLGLGVHQPMAPAGWPAQVIKIRIKAT